MRSLLGIIRFIGVAIIILLYLIPITIGVSIFGKELPWALRMRQRIARTLVWWTRIKITKSGTPKDGNYLFISNHRSYIDPVVQACDIAFLPVAKAEVANWPLFGFGSKVTGILFVKREDKNSRVDIRNAVRNALSEGLPVMIYPEGTTSSSVPTIPFRTGTFQIAAELGIPVVPIAIAYSDPADDWVGNDTFIRHFIETFGKWSSHAYVHYGEPITDTDPERLVERTKACIDAKLAEFALKP